MLLARGEGRCLSIRGTAFAKLCEKPTIHIRETAIMTALYSLFTTPKRSAAKAP